MVEKVRRRNYRSKRVRSRSLKRRSLKRRSLKRRSLKKIKMLRGGSSKSEDYLLKKKIIIKHYTQYEREEQLITMCDHQRINNLIEDEYFNMCTRQIDAARIGSDYYLASFTGLVKTTPRQDIDAIKAEFKKIKGGFETELKKFYALPDSEAKDEFIKNFEEKIIEIKIGILINHYTQLQREEQLIKMYDHQRINHQRINHQRINHPIEDEYFNMCAKQKDAARIRQDYYLASLTGWTKTTPQQDIDAIKAEFKKIKGGFETEYNTFYDLPDSGAKDEFIKNFEEKIIEIKIGNLFRHAMRQWLKNLYDPGHHRGRKYIDGLWKKEFGSPESGASGLAASGSAASGLAASGSAASKTKKPKTPKTP
jgi:hypothetical protein